MSLQAQASQLWAMLDELAAKDPAGYRSFIDRQLADGRSQLEPPRPLFCAAVAVRVASPHLLGRLLADVAAEEPSSTSSTDDGGDSEHLLAGLLAELKVVDTGGGKAGHKPAVGFPTGFSPARLVVVFVSWSRVKSCDLADPSATISAHVGRPFPCRQLPDDLLLPIAFNADTLRQALPAVCLAESSASSTPSATAVATALTRDADARGFVAHALRHCLAQQLRASVEPQSGDLQDDDRAVDYLATSTESLFTEPNFVAALHRALGYQAGDLALQQLVQAQTQMAQAREAPLVAPLQQQPAVGLLPPNELDRVAAQASQQQQQQQQQQQLELTTSLNRVERILTMRVMVGQVAESAADLDVRLEPRLLTIRRALPDNCADSSTAAPLLCAPLPCEVAPDEAKAQFLRSKRHLLLRAPVVGALPPP